MLQELRQTFLPALFVLLGALPAGASSHMEPIGQVLGGSLEAPVRIEIFSNFQCTHCREYYLRTIKKVIKEYSSADKVCVIYHDFPFSYNKYDRKAARYAEAASRIGQDTLIKVFDAFYTEQATWTQNGELEQTLEKALTKEEYRKLLEIAEDPGIDALIEQQYQLAISSGLNSTPTSIIFYPGKQQKVSGLITYVVLKGFIDKIIK